MIKKILPCNNRFTLHPIPLGLLFLFVFINTNLQAQIEFDSTNFHKIYKTSNDRSVLLPLGELSFADSVIAYKVGDPPPSWKYGTETDVLGPPDYEGYPDNTYLSLGCGGQLVVGFLDNGFIDIQGPDLYFFEIGPSVEKFKVEISADKKNWETIGIVDGGSSSVDIAHERDTLKRVRKVYYYIRITDMKDFCRGPTAGTDIDAVATIGGVIRINIDASLLFDTDKYNLKPKAKTRLDTFLKGLVKIPVGTIRIEGHTDSRAPNAYNMELSKNRAESVYHFLKKHLPNSEEYQFKIRHFGEERPVAANDNPRGRQKNRRVEIILIPDPSFYNFSER